MFSTTYDENFFLDIFPSMTSDRSWVQDPHTWLTQRFLRLNRNEILLPFHNNCEKKKNNLCDLNL